MSILIAEDDPVSRRLLEATLRKWGYDVLSAHDGEDAAAQMTGHRPDLVITDIIMPRMNGYDLCRHIRGQEHLKDVPIILLTSLSDPNDVLKALQCGADAFITKPHNKELLNSHIETMVQPDDISGTTTDDGSVIVQLEGRPVSIKPDIKQITSLLLSTYANAYQKNKELQQANQALQEAQEKLRRAHKDLVAKQANLDKDLEAAAGIQRSLLPTEPPASPAIDVAWKFQPCEQIGGDIFNIVPFSDDLYGFYMLDVSGHGVPSALVTVSVSQRLQSTSDVVVGMLPDSADDPQVISPSKVMAQLDVEYPIDRFDKFFSMAYMLIDARSGVLRCTNGGHPPPLLMRADGSVEKLEKGGPIIGMCADLPFEEEEKQLAPGDRVFLYTDGVLEHCNPEGDMYGENRLCRVIEEKRTIPIDDQLECIMQDVMAFGTDTPNDDVSLLGITYHG